MEHIKHILFDTLKLLKSRACNCHIEDYYETKTSKRWKTCYCPRCKILDELKREIDAELKLQQIILLKIAAERFRHKKNSNKFQMADDVPAYNYR